MAILDVLFELFFPLSISPAKTKFATSPPRSSASYRRIGRSLVHVDNYIFNVGWSHEMTRDNGNISKLQSSQVPHRTTPIDLQALQRHEQRYKWETPVFQSSRNKDMHVFCRHASIARWDGLRYGPRAFGRRVWDHSTMVILCVRPLFGAIEQIVQWW